MDPIELTVEEAQQENAGFNDDGNGIEDEVRTETPAPVIEEQPEEVKPEYAQITKAEWESLKNSADLINQLRTTQDKGFGTFGETIRGIKSQLQGMTVGKKFDMSTEKIAQYREDGFPELADAFEFISGMHSAPAMPAPEAVDIDTQIKHGVEKGLLARDHRNWQQIDNDPRFHAFIALLPDDRRQALVKASNEYDSSVVSREMTAFEQSLQKPTPTTQGAAQADQSASRRRIMQASMTPRGSGSANQSAGSTYESGFDSVT